MKAHFNRFDKFCKHSRFFIRLHKKGISSFISGGHGMNHLFKKYKISTHKTSDIDLHVVNTTSITNISILKQFIHEFNSMYPKYLLKISIRSKKQQVANVLLKYNTLEIYTLTIGPKNYNLIDFVFTNERKNITNISHLFKTGIPIKKARFYMLEVLSVILRETFSALKTYIKRNPINGTMKEKGRKDIKRLKKLCKIIKAQPCRLLKVLLKYKKYKKGSILESKLQNEFENWGLSNVKYNRFMKQLLEHV